jgi:hypothetical protein
MGKYILKWSQKYQISIKYAKVAMKYQMVMKYAIIFHHKCIPKDTKIPIFGMKMYQSGNPGLDSLDM